MQTARKQMPTTPRWFSCVELVSSEQYNLRLYEISGWLLCPLDFTERQWNSSVRKKASQGFHCRSVKNTNKSSSESKYDAILRVLSRAAETNYFAAVKGRIHVDQPQASIWRESSFTENFIVIFQFWQPLFEIRKRNKEFMNFLLRRKIRKIQ